MADVYSSLDVLLNPAMGEGFGLPVLEAQACGVPAIVTDFTAMSEVCGAGWKVRLRPRLDADARLAGVAERRGGRREPRGVLRALRAGPARRSRAQAREHALRYDADRVLEEHWLPALDGDRAAARRPAAAQDRREGGMT